jgi:hypothetical protein
MLSRLEDQMRKKRDDMDSSFESMAEILDELVASEEVREAIAEDTGKRVELADVAREAGFDPAELGPCSPARTDPRGQRSFASGSKRD